MQPPPTSDDLARIERRLADLMRLIEHQTIAIATLRDELSAAQRRAEWYDVQFSQMIRLLCNRSNEVRAALLYSVVNDRPIRPEVLEALLQLSQSDE